MTTRDLINSLKKFDPNAEVMISTPFQYDDGVWSSFEFAVDLCYVSYHEYNQGPDSPLLKPAYNKSLQKMYNDNIWRTNNNKHKREGKKANRRYDNSVELHST